MCGWYIRLDLISPTQLTWPQTPSCGARRGALLQALRRWPRPSAPIAPVYPGLFYFYEECAVPYQMVRDTIGLYVSRGQRTAAVPATIEAYTYLFARAFLAHFITTQ